MKLLFSIIVAAIAFSLVTCGSANPEDMTIPEIASMSNAHTQELVVLSPAKTGDPYYADRANDIFDFHIAYASAVLEHGDDVIVLVDDKGFKRYADVLGENHVAVAPMDDIWMRDFSLANAEHPIMFRYTAEGQGGGKKGQRDADAVQDGLAVIINEAQMKYTESNLLNDGGNFVDDYHGNVVVSRKFLRDNALSEAEGRAVLQAFEGVDHVAFIESDEQGGLEHADGVVAFVGKSTLVINAYPQDPDYAEALKADLRAGLPAVKIHSIITPYDSSEIHDARFGSACGLYTNMLVTRNRIYFPQFGIQEDKTALTQLAKWTDLEIVPVMSKGVCPMGGGVRCMSWQLRGDNAKAFRKLLGKY